MATDNKEDTKTDDKKAAKIEELDLDREKDYAEDEDVEEQLSALYEDVSKAFEDKKEQNDTVDRCWDVFNCILNDNQAYNGKSKVYIPVVRDAVEARVTRFTNQLFPQSGRYCDITNNDGTPPYEIISLLDHYVEEAHMRDVVVPSLIRSGEVTGEYVLYVEWLERTRHTLKKTMVPDVVAANGAAPDTAEKHADVEIEEVVDGRPDVWVVDPRNVAVLPASVDEIEDADGVAIGMWWTKAKVKEKMANGEINEEAAETLLEAFGQTSDLRSTPDTEKKASEPAGVKMDAQKRAYVVAVWSKLKINGERRLCVTHFAGPKIILSCKRNPYWCDRVPLLMAPRIKVPGSIWGQAPVALVEQVQYQANDAVNMGMDSAQYSLLPIVMTDPEKNPRVGSMVLSMAALWETSPNDTKFASFPALWKDAMGIVSLCRDQIMQSMGTNPAMMPHANAGKKPSQSQVAQEQQVALESTADATTLLETGILNKLLQWFYEMDYQFRSKDITVKKYGPLGTQADMEQIPPIQVGTHYVCKWSGTETFRSQQQVQQMIAGMNVLRGIPPQMLPGKTIDIAPIIENLVNTVFGAKLAPKVLVDQAHKMAVPAEMENQLLLNLFPVHTSPLDNDQEHLMKHQQVLPMDRTGIVRQHIMEHVNQMKARIAAQNPQAAPPAGGGGPGGPPRIGAQPTMPRGGQNPPGAVPGDQMNGPGNMPRKAM